MLLRQAATGWIGQAPAKVNLFLRVIRRRSDGYHDIETVMSRIALADTLFFRATTDGAIRLNVQLAYPRSLRASPVPATDDNLVVKAARLLQPLANASAGVEIALIKRVPAAAGLGGGSSDAATTLAALNQIWQMGLVREELVSLAAQLGSDVPFFLADSGTALCTGRGESLKPFAGRLSLPLVIARPQSGLATAAVYRGCRPEPDGPDVGPLVTGLRMASVTHVAHRLHNGLQPAAEGLNPDVAALRTLFARHSFRGHQLTGSGTAYFGICRDLHEARRVAGRLRAAGVPWVVATTTVI
ncbi:MAG TPA: 4-(cytidine 5'-diphospho)-2-C-methyl-D-erythritol kinase [Planctomycetaceae bacterium]|nr:4-(cytidine 5'-diphospho)-2-C-methyl-D-erythritol kinase [Planctomycetaceae bacterium]